MPTRAVPDGSGWRHVEMSAEADGLYAQADTAIDTLESAHANWGALTAAQKDAALKLTVRVVTRLARLVLGRLA